MKRPQSTSMENDKIFNHLRSSDLPERTSKGTIGVYGASSKMCFRKNREFEGLTAVQQTLRAVEPCLTGFNNRIDDVSNVVAMLG